MGGSCFWCLTAADYPDYDGFKISFGQQSSQRPAEAGSVQKQQVLLAARLPQTASTKRPASPLRPAQDITCLHNSASAVKAAAAKRSLKHDASASESLSYADQIPSFPDSDQQRLGEFSSAALGAQAHGTGPCPQHPGSSGLMRRVSSRTEGNVEAAAAIFDGEMVQSELQAAHLGAETIYLITQHASAMHALNQQAASRDCCVM